MTVLGLFPTAWSKSSKISYLREFSAQVSQIVFLPHLTLFYGYFITKWRKASKILYLNKFTAQVSQIVFWARLTVLRLITSVWGKTSKNLISPWVQCTSITNRVLSSFDRFTTSYNCMRKNFKNLISLWVQCKSIKNRVLVSYDRFRTFSNCMK